MALKNIGKGKKITFYLLSFLVGPIFAVTIYCLIDISFAKYKKLNPPPFDAATIWNPSPEFINWFLSTKKENHLHSRSFKFDGRNINYTYDKLGRRKTERHKKNVKKHLALFGGSFIFGDHIDDTETFSSSLEKMLPQTRTLNYGIPGSCPSEFLSLLDYIDLQNEIKPANGHIVYTIINDHLDRIRGRINSMRTRAGSPYYYLKDERLYQDGTFQSAKPLTTKFLKLFSRSSLVNYFSPKIPYTTAASDIKLTCKIFEHIKLKLQKQMPQSTFVVLLYPDMEMITPLGDCLVSKNIHTIDYSRMLRPIGDKAHPDEWHPYPQEINEISHWIKEDLQYLSQNSVLYIKRDRN